MNKKFLSILTAGVLLAPTAGFGGETSTNADAGGPPDFLQSIREELNGPLTKDSLPQAGVPQGEIIRGIITNSLIYPGTENIYTVYVPRQYNPEHPACLLIKLDGLGPAEATVLDNLIAKKEIPVMIAVGIVPGTIWRDAQGTNSRTAYRYDRSFEFDSMNNNFPDYVLNELLPEVEKLATKDGRPIRLSKRGNDCATTGASTGGIGAFTLAWRRPDVFGRVYAVIGTFVSMRGGSDYPTLIRKTEPKPIRIFLEDGSTDAWNPLFGSWFTANENMEAALSFAGYDVEHVWGTHGHNGRPGAVIFPDVLRWLWRDWPTPLKAGISHNDMLQSILLPGEGWEEVAGTYQGADGLCANQQGEVYFSDAADRVIYKIPDDGKPIPFTQTGSAVRGLAFGPEGTLYGAAPDEGKIMTFTTDGTAKTITDGIRGHSLVVTSDKTVYATEPGNHSDEPSKLWQIKSNGDKEVIDSGLLAASGLAFSPDKTLLFVAEKSTQWIYSYRSGPDGSLEDKQRFYWLHMTDIPNDSGAEDLAVDTRGILYVATRMGIQVCDRNGRVRAILPLPTPCGPVRALCFGGEKNDLLMATDGHRIFKRKLKAVGYSQWSAPVPLPPFDQG
jgi:sugar lactone lactonase YvrE